MMDDTISRQAAIDAINKLADEYWETTVIGAQYTRASVSVIMGLPSADVQPVRRGNWIEDLYFDNDTVCDQCGEPCATFTNGEPRDRYCKWCGAKMFEGSE